MDQQSDDEQDLDDTDETSSGRTVVKATVDNTEWRKTIELEAGMRDYLEVVTCWRTIADRYYRNPPRQQGM